MKNLVEDGFVPDWLKTWVHSLLLREDLRGYMPTMTSVRQDAYGRVCAVDPNRYPQGFNNVYSQDFEKGGKLLRRRLNSSNIQTGDTSKSASSTSTPSYKSEYSRVHIVEEDYNKINKNAIDHLGAKIASKGQGETPAVEVVEEHPYYEHLRALRRFVEVSVAPLEFDPMNGTSGEIEACTRNVTVSSGLLPVHIGDHENPGAPGGPDRERRYQRERVLNLLNISYPSDLKMKTTRPRTPTAAGTSTPGEKDQEEEASPPSPFDPKDPELYNSFAKYELYQSMHQWLEELCRISRDKLCHVDISGQISGQEEGHSVKQGVVDHMKFPISGAAAASGPTNNAKPDRDGQEAEDVLYFHLTDLEARFDIFPAPATKHPELQRRLARLVGAKLCGSSVEQPWGKVFVKDDNGCNGVGLCVFSEKDLASSASQSTNGQHASSATAGAVLNEKNLKKTSSVSSQTRGSQLLPPTTSTRSTTTTCSTSTTKSSSAASSARLFQQNRGGCTRVNEVRISNAHRRLLRVRNKVIRKTSSCTSINGVEEQKPQEQKRIVQHQHQVQQRYVLQEGIPTVLRNTESGAQLEIVLMLVDGDIFSYFARELPSASTCSSRTGSSSRNGKKTRSSGTNISNAKTGAKTEDIDIKDEDQDLQVVQEVRLHKEQEGGGLLSSRSRSSTSSSLLSGGGPSADPGVALSSDAEVELQPADSCHNVEDHGPYPKLSNNVVQVQVDTCVSLNVSGVRFVQRDQFESDPAYSEAFEHVRRQWWKYWVVGKLATLAMAKQKKRYYEETGSRGRRYDEQSGRSSSTSSYSQEQEYGGDEMISICGLGPDFSLAPIIFDSSLWTSSSSKRPIKSNKSGLQTLKEPSTNSTSGASSITTSSSASSGEVKKALISSSIKEKLHRSYSTKSSASAGSAGISSHRNLVAVAPGQPRCSKKCNEQVETAQAFSRRLSGSIMRTLNQIPHLVAKQHRETVKNIQKLLLLSSVEEVDNWITQGYTLPELRQCISAEQISVVLLKTESHVQERAAGTST
ncbi:unnamed protein product [Amoebophrya sp. A25]|nr:unnamed protein product [Amoebophrya sp. A25]|eukprot:GSA25T00010277001.1